MAVLAISFDFRCATSVSKMTLCPATYGIRWVPIHIYSTLYEVIHMADEATLLFSGGIDSTFDAFHLARRHSRVHLLTFSHGYGQFFMGRAAKRFRELDRHHQGRYVHHLISIRETFRSLFVKDLLNATKHLPGFSWCLSCKLAMHAHAIIYCKNNGLSYAVDGSSADTSEMVEQSDLAIALIQELYKTNSIDFDAPHHSVPRSQKRDFLKEKGLRLGIRVFDRHIGIQPKCIPGELYYSPYLLCGLPPQHREDDIKDFVTSRQRRIQDVIDSGMDGGGE